jgi:hypothetical protein
MGAGDLMGQIGGCMRRHVFVILLISIVTLGSHGNCYSEWIGPKEVVSGKWGAGNGEFGFKEHYMEDGFPKNFFINNRGDIYIVDPINNLIYKYNQQGHLLKRIQKPSGVNYWKLNFPYGHSAACVFFNPDGGFLVQGYKKWQFFGIDDNFIMEKEIFTDGSPFVYKGYLFKDRNKIAYLHYSISGELLARYDESELKKIGLLGVGGLLTLQLLDRNGKWESLMKQRKPFLYQVRFNSPDPLVILPTQCPSEEVVFETPKNKVVPLRPVFEEDPEGFRRWKPDEYTIYERPVLSIDDDMYCVKYSQYVQEKYCIIKWVWTEGPDVPFDLMASTSDGGIVLTWRKPEKDSESVTEYEISRSNDVCGSYNPLSKVIGNTHKFIDKDVKNGMTYYYTVRAIRKNRYSGFSDKAQGVIQ